MTFLHLHAQLLQHWSSSVQVTGITQLSNGKSQHFGSPSNMTTEKQPAADEPSTSQANKNITDVLKGASKVCSCQSPHAHSVTCFVTFSPSYLLSTASLLLCAEHCNLVFHCCPSCQEPVPDLSTSLTQPLQNSSKTPSPCIQCFTLGLQA